MENLLKQLEDLRERAIKVTQLLDIEGKKTETRDLKREINKSDFWNNQEKAIKITKKLEDLTKEVDKWESLRKNIRELEEFAALANKEKDESMHDDIERQYKDLYKKFKDLEFFMLFSGKHDESNTIVSIHAGTGGVDAQDWAQILERMYLRFVEKMNWKVEILDRNIGNEAGIKSAMMMIKGRFAYGYLKSENGVHRLVRISPFDAAQARHTSFALVEVVPEFPEAENLELKESDLRIDVYRSSGPGGQSVNTTDSAVRIVHVPTNITVTCQSERSQHQNKENALKILKAKLYKAEQEKREEEENELKGEVQKAEWGKQIRSYVMQPYRMVKDLRTKHETSDTEGVLNGDLKAFMEAYLRSKVGS